ncbi:hypothetical protein, partial [Streptomyces sp. NPDC058964]|uniref:hypothetical protein n=1 Tax=Streptomyces sp. NPDC058964 TaxID=3346681 RepID=UPI00369CE654
MSAYGLVVGLGVADRPVPWREPCKRAVPVREVDFGQDPEAVDVPRDARGLDELRGGQGKGVRVRFEAGEELPGVGRSRVRQLSSLVGAEGVYEEGVAA